MSEISVIIDFFRMIKFDLIVLSLFIYMNYYLLLSIILNFIESVTFSGI